MLATNLLELIILQALGSRGTQLALGIHYSVVNGSGSTVRQLYSSPAGHGVSCVIFRRGSSSLQYCSPLPFLLSIDLRIRAFTFLLEVHHKFCEFSFDVWPSWPFEQHIYNPYPIFLYCRHFISQFGLSWQRFDPCTGFQQ